MINSKKIKMIILIALTLSVSICIGIVYNIKYNEYVNKNIKIAESYQSFKAMSCKKIENFPLNDKTGYYDLISNNRENLLLYWATWCPHCENLIHSKLWKLNAGTVERNLFSIAEDSSVDQIRNEGPKFPVYIDCDWQQFNKMNCKHLPTLIVVDGDGSVLGSAEGEEECKQLLRVYVHRNRT